MSQRPHGFRMEQTPRIRERHRLPFVPIQQANSHVLLQPLNLRTQGGLRHIEAICRLGEVQLLDHGSEVSQLPGIDHLISISE
ncbi:hypothetical protein D3C72_1829620 [compost metagenome]